MLGPVFNSCVRVTYCLRHLYVRAIPPRRGSSQCFSFISEKQRFIWWFVRYCRGEFRGGGGQMPLPQFLFDLWVTERSQNWTRLAPPWRRGFLRYWSLPIKSKTRTVLISVRVSGEFGIRIARQFFGLLSVRPLFHCTPQWVITSTSLISFRKWWRIKIRIPAWTFTMMF